MSISEQTPLSTAPTAVARQTAIEAVDLTKTYRVRGRAVEALRGVSFAAPAGTILALLGPNGAGKTSTVKILTTLSTATSGTASVAGIDVTADPAAVRRVIGYVSQKPCFDRNLTGRENLTLQARVYGVPRAQLRSRVQDMLDRFDLGEAADRVTMKWSGGMQRKLDVALALIHEPSVLFLDEPTTGLDPEARTELWGTIGALTATGDLTVLLTTHYLEEADRLADQVVIVDQGTVVVSGNPEELKRSLAGDTLQIRLASAASAVPARAALADVPGLDQFTVDGVDVRARAADAGALLPRVLAALDAAQTPISTVTVARPSLDQVYLHHAGRSLRPDTGELVREERVG